MKDDDGHDDDDDDEVVKCNIYEDKIAITNYNIT